MNESKPKKLELKKLAYAQVIYPIVPKDNVEYPLQCIIKWICPTDTTTVKVMQILITVVLCCTICFGNNYKSPFKPNKPQGAIKELIEHRFGDMKSFVDEMIATAMTIQGSGWVYLSKR